MEKKRTYFNINIYFIIIQLKNKMSYIKNICFEKKNTLNELVEKN